MEITLMWSPDTEQVRMRLTRCVQGQECSSGELCGGCRLSDKGLVLDS